MTIPDENPPPLARRIGRRLARLAVRLAIAAVIAFAAINLAWAFASRRLPELQPYHTVELDGELHAGDDGAADMTFEAWLALEDALFAELDEKVYVQPTKRAERSVRRYVRGSMTDPTSFETDWNRTWERTPDVIRGSVLLLHGATDSPYSMRAIGEVFYEHDYYVLAMRMPGHGTIPGELSHCTWEDWMTAVRIGARRAREVGGPNGKMIVGGYSTGGALAVRLAIEAKADETVPDVDGIYLFSPAIGISPFAALSGWHRTLSWIPYFEKHRWLSVSPEYDPFKYTSFPKNGGHQVHLLSRAVQRDLDQAARRGDLEDLPPIVTFQSVVDTTVDTTAIVTRLYDRLAGDGHELILFDVNRSAYLEPLMNISFHVDIAALEARTLDYRVTVVTNAGPDSRKVLARSRGPGRAFAIEPLDLEWPLGIFSLSHVAIPFAPDDPIYGWELENAKLPLGRLEVRGERQLLRIAAADILRLRHNPLFPYLAERLDTLLDHEPLAHESSADESE